MTGSGKRAVTLHAKRRRLAREANQKEAAAELREHEQLERCHDLNAEIRTGEDVLQLLQKNLRLTSEVRIVCPEEGQHPRLYIRLHLCGKVISRIEL